MSLTAGTFFWAACAAILIPILIHILTRGRPRHVVFPPLRLIEERYRSSRRRFRLKQFLLLALRALVLVLFGLLLARPVRHSVPTAETALPGGGAEAAVFVFDTSLRMDYEKSGRTRLDEAKEFALALLDRLAADARVAVFDTQTGGGAFQVDRLAAREAIERLRTAPPRASLAELLARAAEQLKSEPGEKEIFILAGRAAADWTAESADRLARALGETGKECRFYFADFTPEEIRNFSLTDLRIDLARDRGKRDAEIRVTLAAPESRASGRLELTASSITAPGGEIAAVEPFTDEEFDEDNRLEKRFTLRDLADGIYQGTITKTPPDPLAADDRLFFTFEIRPPKKLLFAAPEPAETHAVFMKSAVELQSAAPGRAPFESVVLTYGELREYPLSEGNVAALFLLDPPPFESGLVDRIERFVRGGGGAGFFLGRQTDPKRRELDPLLGGAPLRQVNVPEGAVLLPDPGTHALLAPFGSPDRARSAPWTRLQVSRYWRMEWSDTPPPAALRFADGAPALVERTLGGGRVVLSTTPFSDLPGDPKAWNRITTGDEAWLFLILADGIARVLTGGKDSLNLFPYETAVLNVEGTAKAEVVLPDGVSLAQANAEPAAGRALSFTGTGQLGAYRVLDAESKGPLAAFSVNPRPAEIDLAPVSFERLVEIFGKTPLTRIDSADRLEAARGRLDGRIDLYSLAALLFALVLIAELWAAGRLYD
ncbi:MAG: BatA domain-containing protein [Thermoguttaceae bacterium]|nr:BatA domain-containing protein [Thermoguttaceae bacterium]